MKTRLLSETRCFGYAAALSAAIFVFDLNHPLGVAGAMPYVALPLLGMLARSNRAVVALAATGTVLTLAGMLLSSATAPLYVAAINRAMTVLLTWIVAYVAIRHLTVGNELRASLEKAAFRDPLTGLYNRRYAFRMFENEISRYRRYGDPFSLILIDADYFKRVNDEHGHCAGDVALQAIADTCTAAVRDSDVVGRFGGEEFIILLPHTTADNAVIVAERIRREMALQTPTWQGAKLDVTLSLGVAEIGVHAASFDALLRSADKALYTAKERGRNQTAVAENNGETPSEIRAA